MRMREYSYISLLITCAILSQGIAVISDDNAGESAELYIRKKRLIDKTNIRTMPVQLTMAPYIVNILKDGQSFCAGTILGPEIILTVNNCLMGALHTRFSVLSGSAMRNEGIPHNLTGRMFVSPTGLVLFTIFPPINLYQGRNAKIDLFDGVLPPNEYGTFSGWGSTGKRPSNEKIFPEQLMQTRLPIISLEECTNLHAGHNGPHIFRYICTFDRTGRRATSVGDQGGPLVYRHRLLGVLIQSSLNIGVYPDVFINLNQLVQQQWIIGTMHHLRH